MQQALLSAADVPQGQHEPDVSQGPTSGAGAGLLHPSCPSAVLSLAQTSCLSSSLKVGEMRETAEDTATSAGCTNQSVAISKKNPNQQNPK